ncbi:uncharacterized protein BJ212DRAFT_1342324 [Suillus subaureus]|uniref:Uncharacterized protein n=1 Tax=Suillus subaureus TaxID=48587 RepID=A0A9P7EEX3_9AGAM|nr:uncharacterized protein BJ212DRAFT_1342324 [Suillus subaureus]KAG1819672.1 hypothetical protein BJ212DRAFT_1342324 [Suillus subaureus]
MQLYGFIVSLVPCGLLTTRVPNRSCLLFTATWLIFRDIGLHARYGDIAQGCEIVETRFRWNSGLILYSIGRFTHNLLQNLLHAPVL